MANATPAAAAGATMALARTYMAKYTEAEDVLGGNYAEFYNRYVGNTTPEDIERHVLSSSTVIPKVYLCLTTVNDKPIVSAFHRPSTCRAHPIHASEWDGKNFVF